MRKMIDADLFGDEVFLQFVPSERAAARLFFAGLVILSDQQGRLPDIPAFVRASIFPFGEVSEYWIEYALGVLAREGKILRYLPCGDGQVVMYLRQAGCPAAEDGKGVLQVVNYWRYQSARWASPSKYPPFPGWIDRVRYYTHGKYKEQGWGEAGGLSRSGQLMVFKDYPYCGDSMDVHTADTVFNLTTTTTIKQLTLLINSSSSLIKYCGDSMEVHTVDTVWKNGHHKEDTTISDPPAITAAQEQEAAAPEPIDPDRAADELWRKVKPGALSVPISKRDEILPVLHKVLMMHNYDVDKTAAYVKPFYDRWCNTRGRDGKFYSPQGLGWLDWLSQGQMPQARSNQRQATDAKQLAEELDDTN